MTMYAPLPADIEAAATKVIGCAIEVHRTLGAGFLESIYKRAMECELEAQGLRFESEKAVVVSYKGLTIGASARGPSGAPAGRRCGRLLSATSRAGRGTPGSP